MKEVCLVRSVPFAESEFPSILRLSLRIPFAAAYHPANEANDLLNAARCGVLQLGPAFIHEVGGIPHATVMIVQAPGAAALLLLSPLSSASNSLGGQRCLEEACKSARESGCKLLEVLLDPEHSRDLHWHGPLRNAGFHFLTRLVYLSLQVSESQHAAVGTWGGSWLNFTPDTEPLFLRSLEESYVQTMDCPELTGLRTTAEVLAGHRAAGAFNPRLWKLAMREGKPVGVLLLNPLRGGFATEITYLGVAQTARRTGVANALVREAVTLSREVSANIMALAVDARNVPARRLYAGCGFQFVQHRDVWIAPCAQVVMGSDVGIS